jgi:hypothetical protein
VSPVDRSAARLAAFMAEVDRIRVEDLLTYAAHPLDPAAYRRARETAELVAIEHGRDDEVRDLRERTERYVLTLYGRSDRQPGWYEVNWGRPGTVEDRAWLATSLGSAVMALALADVLPDDVLDELLGPWGTLVPA